MRYCLHSASDKLENAPKRQRVTGGGAWARAPSRSLTILPSLNAGQAGMYFNGSEDNHAHYSRDPSSGCSEPRGR